MVSGRLRKHVQQNIVGYVALFLVLSGGTAYALNGSNTVFSDDIVNDQVRSVDVRNDDLKGGGLAALDLRANSVAASEVADNSMTGKEIDESTLGLVPNANQLDGRDWSAFMAGATYRNEAPTDTGTTLGDGTELKAASCDPGDRLLGGGTASVAAGSRVLDSYPSDPVTWTARIYPAAGGDSFTVVVLCADQTS